MKRGLRAAGLRAELAEFQALQAEPDAGLRASAGLKLARALEGSPSPGVAALLYQGLAQSAPAPVADQARRALEILGGRGGFSERVSFQMEHFSDQVLDPVSLLAMGWAGGVYRATRLAALGRLGRRPLARLWASLAGLGAEVPAFALAVRGGHVLAGKVPAEGLPPLSDELAAATLFLGSLKLTGALAASARNRLPPGTEFGRLAAGLLPSAALFGGIAMGHRLEIAAALRPDRGGGAALAEDLGAFLHLRVAGALSRGLLGKKWQDLELALEVRGGAASGPPLGELRPPLAVATAGAPPVAVAGRDAERFSGLSFMVGREPTPPPERARALEKKYLSLFPPTADGYYSAEILRAACRIPCGLPEFHDRLIDALSYAPNRGSKAQLYTVLAIEDAFAANALRRSTGSLDYAMLQLQIGSAAAEDHRPTRLQSFQKIFRALEGGLDRRAQQDLLLQLPYDEHWAVPNRSVFPESFWTQHREEAQRHWGSYRPKDWEPLLNFAYLRSRGRPELASVIIRNFGEGRAKSFFLAVDIDAALDYARAHPMGMVVMQRLHDILAARDVPAKLAELANEPEPLSTHERVATLTRAGVPEESLARQLNGTEHTGYLNDLRLARKAVSVFQEIGPYLKDPRLTERGKADLVEAFWEFARSGRRLEVEDLYDFWRLAKDPATGRYLRSGRRGDPATEEHIRLLGEGGVSVEILPRQEFLEIDRLWGQTQGRSLALTLLGKRPGERDRILLPELPPLDLGQPAGRDLAFNEIRNRVRFLVHEAEHWRHFRGHFLGGEAASRPLQLAGIGRAERLVSEAMASLEELRWRVRHSDQDYLEVSRRLGLTPVAYLRNLADHQYFAESNAAKALD